MSIIQFPAKRKTLLKGRALDRAIKVELDKLPANERSASIAELFDNVFDKRVSDIGIDAWLKHSTECSRRLLAKLQAGPHHDAA